MLLFLAKSLSGLPLVSAFTYTTTRSLFAFFTAFVLSLVFGRPLFKMLYLSGYKDYPREYGEDTVGSKKYTPQMGGLLIALTGLLSMVLWTDLSSPRIWLIFASIFLFGGIGYFDDTAKKDAQDADKGIGRPAKIIPQTIYGIFLGVWAWQNWFDIFPYIDDTHFGLGVYLPFRKDVWLVVAGPVMIVLTVVWSIIFSNAVNYTDGRDGMLIVPALFCFVVVGMYTFVMGNSNVSSYLLFPFLDGAHELTVVCAAFIGACLGFLWFNCFPAEVFMGDFGALLIGGVLLTIAFLIHQEFILCLAGGIILFQFTTSALQDYIFLRRKKMRLFRGAPFHEGLVGSYKMAEAKVVVRYWIVSAILAAFCLVALKIR